MTKNIFILNTFSKKIIQLSSILVLVISASGQTNLYKTHRLMTFQKFTKY